MQDLECPYCERWCEVNHDDGQGYEEDVKHQMECPHCGKNFVFTTYIIYSYTGYKAECLNGKQHNWKSTNTFPREFSKMECTMCGKQRDPTDAEMLKIKLT